MSFQTVAKVGELAHGDIVPVVVCDLELVLFRQGDAYFATQRHCPHHGADLSDGLVSRGFIICGMHGWKFDIRSGRHELSPMTCLRTYPVRVLGDEIQIDGSP